jgi:hypothetical protein
MDHEQTDSMWEEMNALGFLGGPNYEKVLEESLKTKTELIKLLQDRIAYLENETNLGAAQVTLEELFAKCKEQGALIQRLCDLLHIKTQEGILHWEADDLREEIEQRVRRKTHD